MTPQYKYIVDSDGFIKGEFRGNLPSGWTTYEGDLGELYLNRQPKYRIENGSHRLTTDSDFIQHPPYQLTPIEIQAAKIAKRKTEYLNRSDGLFFEFRYLVENGAQQTDIDAAKAAWVAEVQKIKSEIPII